MTTDVRNYVKKTRYELQKIYQEDNIDDYIELLPELKEFIDRNINLKSRENDFYLFLILTRVAKIFKTHPKFIDDYLEKKFDEDHILRIHYGFDRYTGEAIDEWGIKVAIGDIALLRYIDNEDNKNLNLDDFKKEDHIVDGVFHFDGKPYSALRKLQNKVREEFNYPKIGEGWVNETTLYNNLKNIFKKYYVDVHFHYRPSFLKLQELDIYFEYKNKKVGIEYQGEQHYKPIKFFGGEEGYLKLKERDKKKKKICKQHNVNLIYFKYNESLEKNYIINKLNNEFSMSIN